MYNIKMGKVMWCKYVFGRLRRMLANVKQPAMVKMSSKRVKKYFATPKKNL